MGVQSHRDVQDSGVQSKDSSKTPTHSVGIGGGVKMSEAGVQNTSQAAMQSTGIQGVCS